MIEGEPQRIIEKLAPNGYEYRSFYRKRILFPETGNDPIMEDIGYTQRQLDVALELQHFKQILPFDLFPKYLKQRDERIINGLTDIEVFRRMHSLEVLDQ